MGYYPFISISFNLCVDIVQINFLPEASFVLRVLSLPVSVCPCVHMSVRASIRVCRAITHHSFRLRSLNVDNQWKKLLRSLLFRGTIDLELQGQIYLKGPDLSYFELVCSTTHHSFNLGPPSFVDYMCNIHRLKSLSLWGATFKVIFNFEYQNLRFYNYRLYITVT